MTNSRVHAPRLKAGTYLYRQNHVANGYLIGNSRSQVAINSGDAPALYAALAQGADRNEICANLSISHEDFGDLLSELSACELLQTENSAIQVSQRFISQIAERAEKFGDRSKDAALSQMRNRIEAELTLTRWLPGVGDSGASKVSARQGAHIEISGNSRAAQHLFAQLIASGVTDTQFAPTFRRGAELVGDLDVTGGYLSAIDNGQVFVKSSAAIAKSLSLFPAGQESAEEVPNNFAESVIKVHFGELDPAILALRIPVKVRPMMVKATMLQAALPGVGANAPTNGMRPPAVKLSADAIAACTGRALVCGC